jgi:DNA invertase Pin-like site-specific DNA recombinase
MISANTEAHDGRLRIGTTELWAHRSGRLTTPHGRLMLTVLGGLAEFERELILART